MSTAEHFQHRADSLAYEAAEANAALRKQWDRLRDHYIDLGAILQRAKRLVGDPEFRRLVAAHEVDTSTLEPMLAEVGNLCTRIANAMEDER